MSLDALASWGRYPKHPQTPHPVYWPDELEGAIDAAVTARSTRTLAFGLGRSYGDSCMAESDHVVVTRGMDRILAVDWEEGVVRAQAGLTLAELIRVALPRGWFPSVTPGTKFVTLGGAVANDVHGKNHHVMGTFGNHVKRLRIYRTDEGIVECTPNLRSELFNATIGGLGLTGIVLDVELQLRPVSSANLAQRSIKFGDLNEFFALSAQYDDHHEYAVAWVDCIATGRHTGRGHYIVGDHARDGLLGEVDVSARRMPFDPPVSLVTGLSLRAFNTLYYHRQRRKSVASVVGYDSFFYPLDKLLDWNRIYGRAGFQQYQCVVPDTNAPDAIKAVLAQISTSGTGSFLAVLKRCGNVPSPGLLSFPLPGVSLALDFPQKDAVNKKLFSRLDALVHEAGGRLYPAKDAHMGSTYFQQAYPQWTQLEALRDPRLMSRFWHRVTQ